MSRFADIVASWLRRDTVSVAAFGSGAATIDIFGGAPSAAGIAVTPHTAMRSTPVRCAVQAISEAIGQLPIHVFERQADGSRDRAPSHPVYVLLKDQPNDWTTASDFFEQVTRDALLHGNGFAFINRSQDLPVEMVRLDPATVTVERDSRTSEPLYKILDNGSQRYLDRRDVLHIKAPSLDGLKGESPIVQGKEAISLALAMERHAAQLFGNGARPSGILKFPQKLGADTAPRIKDSWNRSHAGGNRSGGTAVLEEGGDFVPLTFSSVDAQFLELWQHCIAEIARIFRVPPVLLMDYGRATWSNSEEMGRQFLTYSLMRWVKAWQGEIRLKLFAPEERERFFAEFLLDDLLRADIGKRFDAYAKAIAARVLNPNEVRARENLPPYRGGDEFVNPNITAGSASEPQPQRSEGDE